MYNIGVKIEFRLRLDFTITRAWVRADMRLGFFKTSGCLSFGKLFFVWENKPVILFVTLANPPHYQTEVTFLFNQYLELVNISFLPFMLAFWCSRYRKLVLLSYAFCFVETIKLVMHFVQLCLLSKFDCLNYFSQLR